MAKARDSCDDVSGALPSSRKVSLSLRATLKDVSDPAADAEPPLTEEMLTVAVSEPSYALSSVTEKLDVPVVEPAEIVTSEIAE
jgi:hypothetical protein